MVLKKRLLKSGDAVCFDEKTIRIPYEGENGLTEEEKKLLENYNFEFEIQPLVGVR